MCFSQQKKVHFIRSTGYQNIRHKFYADDRFIKYKIIFKMIIRIDKYSILVKN